MLENAFQLLAGSLFLMLRIAPSGSYPRPLSRDEERECLGRAAAGDLEARNKLVEHNMRLVAHIVKKYYSQSGELDDLLSIGTIGLIKGINSYRADRGVRLATYASRCIENEILMHFRAQRKTAGEVSLSEALDSEDEDGNLSFLDVVAQEDDLAERVNLREECDRLRCCVETELDAREEKIIRLRYGLGGAQPLTQNETAQRCGISRSYVSRIEKKALEKLRRAMERA